MFRNKLAISFVVMFGCGVNTQGVQLETDKGVYELMPGVGTMVVLQLLNGSPDALHYNLCGSRLERKVQGVWMSGVDARVCTASASRLDSFANGPFYSRGIDASVGPGTYRFVTNVDLAGKVVGASSPREVVGNVFELRMADPP